MMGQQFSRVPNPAGLIYLQEFHTVINLAHVRPALRNGQWWAWHYKEGGVNERYSVLHRNGGNVVFADGHATWRDRRTLTSGEFGLKPGDHTWTTSWEFPYQKAF